MSPVASALQARVGEVREHLRRRATGAFLTGALAAGGIVAIVAWMLVDGDVWRQGKRRPPRPGRVAARRPGGGRRGDAGPAARGLPRAEPREVDRARVRSPLRRAPRRARAVPCDAGGGLGHPLASRGFRRRTRPRGPRRCGARGRPRGGDRSVVPAGPVEPGRGGVRSGPAGGAVARPHAGSARRARVPLRDGHGPGPSAARRPPGKRGGAARDGSRGGDLRRREGDGGRRVPGCRRHRPTSDARRRRRPCPVRLPDRGGLDRVSDRRRDWSPDRHLHDRARGSALRQRSGPGRDVSGAHRAAGRRVPRRSASAAASRGIAPLVRGEGRVGRCPPWPWSTPWARPR